MRTWRALLISSCLLLADCGDGASHQAENTFRLAATITLGGNGPSRRNTEFRDTIDGVFAHDEAIATDAAAALAAAKRTDVRIVSGLAGTAEARQLVADGTRAGACACTTAPAAAVDLSLLLVNGIAVPKELGLGGQWFTRANLVAGGAHEAAPGDFVLDTLRRQYAGTLTTTPTTDVAFRVGLVDGGSAVPGGAALRAELVEAARRYPQLQLDTGPDAASAEQQQAVAREFIRRDFNALLVVPTAPMALSPVCAEAMAQNMKVVVLGKALGSADFLCWVGADTGALGRAAAAAMKQVLPAGGDVIELQGNEPSATARHEAFVRALGVKQP